MLNIREMERFAQPLVEVYAHVTDVLLVNIAPCQVYDVAPAKPGQA